jgi:hypothetical protein
LHIVWTHRERRRVGEIGARCRIPMFRHEVGRDLVLVFVLEQREGRFGAKRAA